MEKPWGTLEEFETAIASKLLVKLKLDMGSRLMVLKDDGVETSPSSLSEMVREDGYLSNSPDTEDRETKLVIVCRPVKLIDC